MSAFPADVTGAMVAAMDQGVATINAVVRQVGATFSFHNAGVGEPTANIRIADAMTDDEFDKAARIGIAAVESVDADLFIFGEIGIGNSTPAAAVTAAVLGGPAADWVGPGTGVVGEALANKQRVVAEAVDRVGVVNPIEALRCLGGKEIVAMAAATLSARHRGIPVLLDGFIATSAVVPLHASDPAALDHVRAGHTSQNLVTSANLPLLVWIRCWISIFDWAKEAGPWPPSRSCRSRAQRSWMLQLSRSSDSDEHPPCLGVSHSAPGEPTPPMNKGSG